MLSVFIFFTLFHLSVRLRCRRTRFRVSRFERMVGELNAPAIFFFTPSFCARRVILGASELFAVSPRSLNHHPSIFFRQPVNPPYLPLAPRNITQAAHQAV